MDGRERQICRSEGGEPRILRTEEALNSVIDQALHGLPSFRGNPIALSIAKQLTVSAGKLHSDSDRGMAVSAASYLLERRMVLDVELLDDTAEFRRILIHEMFHFVWRRLGNTRRSEWHTLIADEREKRARGELGWSAEWRKDTLGVHDRESKSRRWRQYLCESFCDTAAWYFGIDHPEHTLADKHRQKRREWFERLVAAGWLPV